MRYLLTLFILFLTLTSTTTNAQQPGSIDFSFNPIVVEGDGPNATVYTTLTQNDGKIIIGGNFTTYNGISRNGIARLNTDGSLDTTFDPGTGIQYFQAGSSGQPEIRTISIQSDGKIIIGGLFQSYNGIDTNNIARLNTDGTLDLTFNSGDGIEGDFGSPLSPAIVNSISIQSDGKIIIGGQFLLYNGIDRIRIVRVNTDGTIDTTFNPGTGADRALATTAPQSDGKIIIGGSFTSYNGTTRNRIARLNEDGTLDTTFNPGTGTNSGVNTIYIQSNGKIIIGGNFTSYNGTTRNRIARLNEDGTLDGTFNPSTGFENGRVYTTYTQNDGKIIVGGGFNQYNGISVKGVARLNIDGSLDATFNPGTGFENGQVLTTYVQNDSKIIVGGAFTSYNGNVKIGIVKLNSDGSLDSLFNPPMSETDIYVRTSSIQNDGKIIIGGGFNQYNGISVNRLARLNIDGSLDASFNPNGEGITNSGNITHTYVQNDGKIIIKGNFNGYNGISRTNIARLNIDGSLDTFFNANNNFPFSLNALQDIEEHIYGKIILVGTLPQIANYLNKKYILRLNTNGTIDYSFNTAIGPDKTIYDVAIQSDGKIIIVGDFTSYDGISRSGVARLNTDGTLDTTFNPGTGFTYYYEGTEYDGSYKIPGRLTVSIDSNGKIIISGIGFNQYNGIPTNYTDIVRLNTDGTLDTTFNSGASFDYNGLSVPQILSTAIQSNDKIIITGIFTSYNGITTNGIARINTDGTLDTTFNPGIGPNDPIRNISIQNDDNIIIAGDFTSYDGNLRNYITRINGNADPYLSYPSFIKSTLKIYPNPVSNQLNVICDDNLLNRPYVIYDLRGKAVKTGNLNTEIDVNKLENGIYLLKIANIRSIKFIKN